MRLGVYYYPDHWPEKRWSRDFDLMEEANIEIVKTAEFAWTKMEPEKGEFNFSWLERAIDELSDRGIRVVLGTPTAAPPAWIINNDESILPVDEKGNRTSFGARRHYCPNHPGYKEHTRRIVDAMGAKFGDDNNILGWVIDNELHGSCYCEYCKSEFHEWLKEKYETLDRLNESWGTEFWSQTYTDWSQIPTPKATTIRGAHNPGLHLDYYRFISDSWVKYQQLQIDVLEPLIDNQWITHNSMFRNYNGIDYSKLNNNLDLVSWDNYPLLTGQREDSSVAEAHDMARGLGGTGYWVMEQQSGPAGWQSMAKTPQEGQIRLWAYQSIARGADTIIFFRWRTCRTGTEQFWHGVLDHHGEPGRRYQEVKQLGQELDDIGDEIAPEGVPSSVVVIKDYQTLWAFDIQPNSSSMNYNEEISKYHKSLYDQNIPIDEITPRENFENYRFILAPNLYLVSDTLSARLVDFVREGGTLLLSFRSGVKERKSNKVVNTKLPGKLKKLVGATVEDYTTLAKSPWKSDESDELSEKPPMVEFVCQGLSGTVGKASIWVEALNPKQAKPIANYKNGMFDNQPAITINNFGKGQVMYVGTSLTERLHKVLARWMIDQFSLRDTLNTPNGVEAIWRGEHEVLFLLNHNPKAKKVDLTDNFCDLLSGDQRAKIQIPPFGVKVLKRDNN
ncbi:beta-galactosidase [Candidatus Bipolaricaulota bacterium]|nr:beta-galactosidase [Candidatus Bipolaricaulota bacterium]